MKTLVYLAGIILAAPLITRAQPVINWPYHNNHNIANRPDAYGSRMIAESQSVYTTTTGAYILEDSSNYSYSGDRGGDADHTPLSDYSDIYLTSPGGFDKAQQTITTYDAFNNKLTEILQTANAGGGFDNNLKSQYTYNTAHLLLTDTSYTWQAGRWNPTTVSTITYNMSGRPATREIYLNANGWHTIPEWRGNYTYDANDSLIELISMRKVGGALENHLRDQFTYNLAGQVTATRQQAWNGTAWATQSEAYWHINAHGDEDTLWTLEININTSQLDTMSRGIAVFDVMYNPAEIRNEQYDYSLHTFIKTDSTANFYDANNNLTTQISSRFDAATQSYLAPVKNTLLYNNFNQCIEKRKEQWNLNTWQPEDLYRLNRYYYENYFPATVAQLPQQGGTLQLYPIPANNTLNVTINWKEAQPYTLTIADMQGRVNMQYQSNNANETIDVSALPAGVYNIILKGDKGGVQHGRFSVVR